MKEQELQYKGQSLQWLIFIAKSIIDNGLGLLEVMR